MHFLKAVVSSAIIALPMAAMAAPATDAVASVDVNSPSEIDSLIAQLVALVESEHAPAVEARDLGSRPVPASLALSSVAMLDARSRYENEDAIFALQCSNSLF